MTNLDLIDWTMHEARQLSPEHNKPRELEAKPSLTKLLEVLEGSGLSRARMKQSLRLLSLLALSWTRKI
jgi:hypothetical protein